MYDLTSQVCNCVQVKKEADWRIGIMHSLWFILVLQEEFSFKLQNALLETAGQRKKLRKRKRWSKKGRKRRDFIARINGNNITRFSFRQLFTLNGIVFHQRKAMYALSHCLKSSVLFFFKPLTVKCYLTLLPRSFPPVKELANITNIL